MANIDFRNTGLLGGIIAAQEDTRANIEFEQTKNLNALKLRQLTGQINEWEQNKGYRAEKQKLELEKDKVYMNQAKATTAKMWYDLKDDQLNDVAERVATITDEASYEDFIKNVPDIVKQKYDIPESYTGGGKHFIDTFYTERLLNMETRRKMLELERQAALKKKPKGKDNLPTPNLVKLEVATLKSIPELAGLDPKNHLPGIANKVVARAQEYRQQYPDMSWDDASEMARLEVLDEMTKTETQSTYWGLGDDKTVRTMREGILKKNEGPGSYKSANKPIITTKEEYEALPKGATFIYNGQLYEKP